METSCLNLFESVIVKIIDVDITYNVFTHNLVQWTYVFFLALGVKKINSAVGKFVEISYTAIKLALYLSFPSYKLLIFLKIFFNLAFFCLFVCFGQFDLDSHFSADFSY